MRRVLIAVAATAAIFSSAACGNPYGNDREVTITVEDKERVCSGNTDGGTDCQYLVYTDQGTFKNVDSYLNKKTNSSDLHGELKEGQTYTVLVEGYRSGWQSEYPNIIRILGNGR